MHRFDDRVVFITGGARGIGKACGERLASEGARIVVADIDLDAARDAAAQLPGDSLAVVCDVTDRASIAAAVAAVREHFGRLDVLVNNVGIASGVKLEDLDDDEWDRQLDPTLHGAVRCIQACLPLLLEAPGGGRVVSISSVNGMAAIGEIAYSAAKAGVINATQNLAVQYSPRIRGTIGAEKGWIRFNVVAPGTIETRVWSENGPEQAAQFERLKQLYPMGRAGRPSDIAAAVAFLASDDASWVTGVTLPVEGGFLAGPMLHLRSLRPDAS